MSLQGQIPKQMTCIPCYGNGGLSSSKFMSDYVSDRDEGPSFECWLTNVMHGWAWVCMLVQLGQSSGGGGVAGVPASHIAMYKQLLILFLKLLCGLQEHWQV